MNETLALSPRPVDHLVLPVGDLEEARKRFLALGFTVAPVGRHPFGTANVCTFLADNSYLEMLAIDRPDIYEKAATRGHSFVQRDKAWRFRNGQNGFSAMVMGTADAKGDHRQFVKAQLSGGRMVDFTRPFITPNGSRDKASFRLAFAADLRAPDTFFFTCQRIGVPNVDRTALQIHENGALALREVLICEEKPADFQHSLQVVLQASHVVASPDRLDIASANANISVLTPALMQHRVGWSPEMHGRGLRLAGLVYAVRALSGVEETLTRNGFSFSKRENRIVVAPAVGQGALFVFEE